MDHLIFKVFFFFLVVLSSSHLCWPTESDLKRGVVVFAILSPRYDAKTCERWAITCYNVAIKLFLSISCPAVCIRSSLSFSWNFVCLENKSVNFQKTTQSGCIDTTNPVYKDMLCRMWSMYTVKFKSGAECQ